MSFLLGMGCLMVYVGGMGGGGVLLDFKWAYFTDVTFAGAQSSTLCRL